MYTLYYSPGTASFAVHWMLIELKDALGIDYTLARVDLGARQHKQPEYLKLNPNGLVPTLIVDGAPAYEAAALLMLLAERHPEAGFAPPVGSAERAAYLQWMMHLSNTVQAAFHGWFHPDWFANDDDAKAQVKGSARAALEEAWGRIDQHLAARGGYFTGAQPSAVDFLATTTMRWSRNMPRPATSWPAIAAYVARMKQRPSFQALYAAEGLTDWA